MSDKVSVPFRGSRSEMHKFLREYLQKVLISVPFRGSRSEITSNINDSISTSCPFPSPFGVHVLKLDKGLAAQLAAIDSFPSPFGVHVLKLDKGLAAQLAAIDSFPSPFGVHVLKCIGDTPAWRG